MDSPSGRHLEKDADCDLNRMQSAWHRATQGLDPTTRVRAADLCCLLAYSGLERAQAVSPGASSLCGRQLASVETLCAFLLCVSGVRRALVLHVVFWTACRATPVKMHTVFMSLCVAAQCEVFLGTAVLLVERHFRTRSAI